MTRNGIEYNLKLSPYIISLQYKYQSIIFSFSSNAYLEKFIKLKDIKSKENNYKISKLFEIDVEINILSDLYLYSKIEKRGYFITVINDNNEVNVECQNNLILNGEMLTIKN